MIIIGIDPGSRVTGYGLIRLENNQSYYIESGCVRLKTTQDDQRLQQLLSELQQIVSVYQPVEAAIEQVFMHQNPHAALKLGQARGAAIAALGIPVAEYTARQIKQAVVGYGAANKEQVNHMVSSLLNISKTLPPDAADALAIALCHAHSRLGVLKLGTRGTRKKRSSWRNYLL